jgi:DNA mismatch endonuclease (patch repair protein)
LLRPHLAIQSSLRYRLHASDLPGKPDIVFPTRKLVIFVHGCFWHRHPDPSCKLARLPKSRLRFWWTKLEANRERDKKNKAILESIGWQVVEVWECELSEEHLEEFAYRIARIPKLKSKSGLVH